MEGIFSLKEIISEVLSISILHGKINIIKDQFRNNTFQIEVNSNNLKLDGFEKYYSETDL